MENKNPDNSINYFNDEWIKIAKEIVTFTCSRESTPISQYYSSPKNKIKKQ